MLTIKHAEQVEESELSSVLYSLKNIHEFTLINFFGAILLQIWIVDSSVL